MESNNHRAITDEHEEAKNQEVQALRRENELEDLRRILATPEGVRFFKRFLDEGKMFTTAMTGNSWTYHNEGKRDFVLKFFNDVCIACPSKIPELILRLGP